MIAILGIFIIILGLLDPIISAWKIPPVLFYWIGFLLLLNAKKQYPKHALMMKWAGYGVLLNAICVIALLQIINILMIFKKSNATTVFFTIGTCVLSPISALVKFIFPHPYKEIQSSSIVTWVVYYLRGTLTSFLDVLCFAVIGALAGIYFVRRCDRKIAAENM